MRMRPQIVLLALLLVFGFAAIAQQEQSEDALNDSLARQLNNCSQEDLLNLPLEELMQMVNALKLQSIEELYELVLNPVITTASKKAEDRFDSPLSTSVISRAQIEAAGVTSIPEALRLLPGLIVREKTNGNYDVHIRGNDNVPPGKLLFDAENTLTLVMIDNRPVYSYLQGGTLWEALGVSLEEVDRIEVVAGPASALYGPNAVSGVIHILTRRTAADDQQFESRVEAGNVGAFKAYMGSGFAVDSNLSFRISGSYSHRDRFQDHYLSLVDYQYHPSSTLDQLISRPEHRYPDTQLAFNKMIFNFCGQYRPRKNVVLDLSGGLQESQAQTIYLDINNLALTRRESRTQFARAALNWGGLKSQVAYHWGMQDNAYGFYGYKFNIKNVNALLEYKLEGQRGVLEPGISFSRSVYSDTPYLETQWPGSGLLNGSPVISNVAAYVRGEYRPSPHWRLVGALRNDQYNEPQKGSWSYQVAAVYQFDPNSLMRAVVSKANRGPFMYDFHGDFTGYQLTQEGYTTSDHYEHNPHLKLVTMNMIELGYRHRIRKNLHSDIAFFYSRATDFSGIVSQTDTVGNTIHTSSTKTNLSVVAQQVGTSFQLSAVPSSRFRISVFGTAQLTLLSEFSVPFNYNYSNTQTDLIAQTDFYHRSTPAFYGGANVTYAPKKRFRFNTNLYYISKQSFFSVDGITAIAGKPLLNAVASYAFSPWAEIYVNARNVLNIQSIEYSFADENRALYLVGLKVGF